MDSPSPVPFSLGLVVKNGSNIFDMTASGMPGPVSSMETCTWSSFWSDRTHMVPCCSSMASMALLMKFTSTCSMQFMSALMFRGSRGSS